MNETLTRLHRRVTPKRYQEGRWGYVLAWLLGAIPILVLVYLLRGCT